MSNLNCKCKVCGKEFEYGDKNSPCLTDEKWKEVVNFYNLGAYEEKASELLAENDPWLNENFVDKDEYHLYICSDCMEKALGRKILQTDLSIPDAKAKGMWYYNFEFENSYFK